MGRTNGNQRRPQRSNLISDRERRTARAKQAFALYRPVAEETIETIYGRMVEAQQSNDIPGSFKLHRTKLHASIVQERRTRQAFVSGYALGFASSSIFGHVESSLTSQGREKITAKVTAGDAIGRNHGILIARIVDEEGRLKDQRETFYRTMGSLGLHLSGDRYDHLTLGESKAKITDTECNHIRHVVGEILGDIPILLEPVELESNGKRVPLSMAKQIDTA